MPLILYLPAALCFILGTILVFRQSKSKKISPTLMGAFFDGLGLWWILKTVDYAPAIQKLVLILSLAVGGLALIADALNIEKRPKDS